MSPQKNRPCAGRLDDERDDTLTISQKPDKGKYPWRLRCISELTDAELQNERAKLRAEAET